MKNETRAQKLVRKRKEQGMTQESFWNDKEGTEALIKLREMFPKKELTKDQLLSACVKFTSSASKEEIEFICRLNQPDESA